MPRFVLLEHRFLSGQPGRNHWDLMLETDGQLLTWALEENPFSGSETAGVQLPLHRSEYLDYEGPISGQRGEVRRGYAGSYLWLDVRAGQRTLFIEFTDGSQWLVRIRVSTSAELEPLDFFQVGQQVQVDACKLLSVSPQDRPNWANSRLPKRGVIGVVQRADQYLVIRRSQTVRAPGSYCFPGGSVEAGESDVEALKRELREELAIHVQPLRTLWENTSPWGVELCWMLAQVEGDLEWVVNPAEVDWAGWMSLTDMAALDPLLPSNRAFLQAWREGYFDLSPSPNPSLDESLPRFK